MARAAGLLGFWLVLSDAAPGHLAPGVLAVAAATWASLALLPPVRWRPRPLALAGFAVRFLGQSVIAGADVVRCALDPRLPVRPGFVTFPVRIPPGPARGLFSTVTSLVPGTTPAGPDERGGLIVHCLDVGRPVVAQLAVEEALLIRALGVTGRDG